MEEFLKLSTSSVALVLAIIPGFLSRAIANQFASEARSLSAWSELMHSALVSLVFWSLFSATGQLDSFKPSEGQISTHLIALALVFIGFSALLVVLWRLAVPWALIKLNERYPNLRWSAGDRSPWLVALSFVGRENLVTVWTKSGVVYYGAVFVAPTREDDQSIVLDVFATASRLEGKPHRSFDLVQTPQNSPRRLVVISLPEIDALEIVDKEAEKKEKRESGEETPLTDSEEHENPAQKEISSTSESEPTLEREGKAESTGSIEKQASPVPQEQIPEKSSDLISTQGEEEKPIVKIEKPDIMRVQDTLMRYTANYEPNLEIQEQTEDEQSI